MHTTILFVTFLIGLLLRLLLFLPPLEVFGLRLLVAFEHKNTKCVQSASRAACLRLLSLEPASFDDLFSELLSQQICWLGGQEMHIPVRITNSGALIVAR